LSGKIGKFLAVCSVVCSLVFPARTHAQDSVDERIDRAYGEHVHGTNTNFAELDKAMTGLLATHTNSEEREKILYSWAEGYAQSGQRDPAGTIKRCHEAIHVCRDPVKLARLFTYLGDAMQVADAGAKGLQLVKVRKDIAGAYLSGIASPAIRELPKSLPALPALPELVPGKITRELMKAHEERDAVVIQRREVEKKIGERDVLARQVAFLYSRHPYYLSEITGLVRDRLDRSPAAEIVLDLVQKEMQRRGPNADPNEAEKLVIAGRGSTMPETKATTSRIGRHVGLWIGILIAAIGCLAFLAWRLLAQRRMQS
jgi:hypothetical protein